MNDKMMILLKGGGQRVMIGIIIEVNDDNSVQPL